MKILFLISFALAAISSARSIRVLRDITTELNNSINENFRNMSSDTINKLFHSMKTLNSFDWETIINGTLPFEHEHLYFTNITVTPVKVQSVKSANFMHEYPNTMVLFFPHLSIEMKGYVGTTPNTTHVGFARSLDFKNILIRIIAGKLDFSQEQVIYFSYVDCVFYNTCESTYLKSPWFHEDLTPEVRHQLERQIYFFLPSLFEYNLKTNGNFTETLDATYFRFSEKIIWNYFPSLEGSTTKSYYFIPNITSLDRTLSNITIIGMQNFKRHEFAENSNLTISILEIANRFKRPIHGTADLHYAGEDFVIFPLYFEANSISISFDRKKQSICVTAQNYKVIETKTNVTLTEYQSKWVMEGIQVAIASSIMPSMKYYRNWEESVDPFEEHPIVKISTKSSQQFKGSTIQNLYDSWNITIPESFKAESSIQIESHDYNILIDAKPRTALKPYPDRIHCYFYHNLKIFFTIPSWFGKISVFNTTHEVYDIHFLTGDISIHLVKQNNSNDFELESFRTLDVELLPNPYNFSDHDRLEIEQKTQQLITSLIKKTVTLFAEPLLSLPLDHCTAPVKIFDDFLPFYADNELPIRVPDSSFVHNLSLYNMTNVTITEWMDSPFVSVRVNQDLVNGSMKISTQVDLEFTEGEVQMNFKDRPLDEFHITLTGLQVRNYTNTGGIHVSVMLSPGQKTYVFMNYKTFSFSIWDMVWNEIKLQHILREYFNNRTSLVF